MGKIFACQMCGKEFETNAWFKKYCSETCAKKAIHQKDRERLYQGHPRSRATHYLCATDEKRAAKERKENQERLRQMAVEARNAGMSYGKYVAMLELKKQNERNGFY